jgi:uncharacterized protein (TIGR00251 family)
MDLHPLLLTLKAEGKVSFQVRVIPRSPVTAWAGVMAGGVSKLKLAAVPEKGKANEELVRFLAAEFGVSRRNVEIVSGASSHAKLVRITA